MRITIRQKNLEITPALQEYIDEKIVRPIGKLLSGAEESDLPILDIEVERTTKHHRKGDVYRAEANLTLGAKLIRAEAEDVDIRAACDAVHDELAREIKTFKEKHATLQKRSARKAKEELQNGIITEKKLDIDSD